jgi:hypothetical protein
MPRTRNDLVNQALANLGILAAGQTAAAEDFDAVDGYVDSLVAWLDETDVVTVDDLSAIPDSWFNALAVLLADDCALQFGLPGVPAKPSAPNPRQGAIDDIRLVVYGRPTYQVQKTEYF